MSWTNKAPQFGGYYWVKIDAALPNMTAAAMFFVDSDLVTNGSQTGSWKKFVEKGGVRWTEEIMPPAEEPVLSREAN